MHRCTVVPLPVNLQWGLSRRYVQLRLFAAPTVPAGMAGAMLADVAGSCQLALVPLAVLPASAGDWEKLKGFLSLALDPAAA